VVFIRCAAIRTPGLFPHGHEKQAGLPWQSPITNNYFQNNFFEKIFHDGFLGNTIILHKSKKGWVLMAQIKARDWTLEIKYHVMKMVGFFMQFDFYGM
jgi:hypothetical protein